MKNYQWIVVRSDIEHSKTDSGVVLGSKPGIRVMLLLYPHQPKWKEKLVKLFLKWKITKKSQLRLVLNREETFLTWYSSQILLLFVWDLEPNSFWSYFDLGSEYMEDLFPFWENYSLMTTHFTGLKLWEPNRSFFLFQSKEKKTMASTQIHWIMSSTQIHLEVIDNMKRDIIMNMGTRKTSKDMGNHADITHQSDCNCRGNGQIRSEKAVATCLPDFILYSFITVLSNRNV